MKNLPKSIPSLRVEGSNPEFKDPKWLQPIQAGTSKKLRWWQPDAFNKLKDAQFGLVAAFCGSGKSIVQIALAIHDIVKSKYKRKQLIIVPQSHIGLNFVGDDELKHIPIMVEGKKYEWLVNHDFCNESSFDVIEGLKAWLLMDAKTLAKKFQGKVISGLNAVASHQALGLVWKKLNEEQKKIAIKNLTLRLDEAHHVNGVFDLDEDGLTDEEKLAMESESTNLGGICRFIINSKNKSSKIHMTTATPYRGDKSVILSPAVKDMFTVYHLDWLDHWKTLGIENFVVEYEEYDGDPIEQIIQKIKKEPNEKHLIVVPSSKQKWRVSGEPEIEELLQRLSKAVPSDRILNLVNQDTQKQNKALLLQEPKTGLKQSNFDVIVTCMLGREGTDWCPCSRVHNTSCENSITLAVQTAGRPFRRFAGKESVRIYYYVNRFPVPKKGMTKRELLSDRTNALLVCIQLDEMSHPILIPELPKKRNKTGMGCNNYTSLMQVFGDRYQSVKEQLISEIECLETKNQENLFGVIDDILHEFDIEDEMGGIRNALYLLSMRVLSPPLRNMGIDVAFLRKEGFDKIIEKYGIANSSIFFGAYTESDWHTIRSILKSRWEEMCEEYKKRFGKAA